MSAEEEQAELRAKLTAATQRAPEMQMARELKVIITEYCTLHITCKPHSTAHITSTLSHARDYQIGCEGATPMPSTSFKAARRPSHSVTQFRSGACLPFT